MGSRLFSLGKTEAILFTLNRGDYSGIGLTLESPESVIPVEDSVKLLGAVLDSKLSFKSHINRLKSETVPRIKQLAAISASSWGPNTLDMMAVFQSYIRSKFLYAAAIYGAIPQ